MYGTYLTLAALLLLAYELWRASSTPGLQKISRRAFLAGGIVLALLLVVGRRLGHDASGSWAASLEFISMGLIGSSFLIFVCLFPVDLILGFGLFFCPDGGRIRGPRRGRLAAVGAYPRRADRPLNIATRMANPLLAGRYDVEGMTVLVNRGAGTWGPRMRLWRPGEIMLVTLRMPRNPARSGAGINGK